MDDIVACNALTKRFGSFAALTDCTLGVRRGEIFGLLGPNGAGKTTLLRLLLGFLSPSSGSAVVDGFDPTRDGLEVRRRISYLPGDAQLPTHMRGRTVLRFFADMHPDGDLDRSLAVAERLELDVRRHVAFMSTGMRQKLALAVVLGPRTPLLILDEPTANLDPTVRSAVLDLAMQARREGRTVVFSSHVLSEIEQTCDRVAFLRQGRLVHQLSLDQLSQRHRITAVRSDESPDVPEELRDSVTVSVFGESCGKQTLRIDTTGDLASLFTWLDSLQLQRVRIEPMGLRSVYEEIHDLGQVGQPRITLPMKEHAG